MTTNTKLVKLYEELVHQAKVEGIYDQNTVDLLLQELKREING